MTDDPLRRAALALLEACDRTGQEPFPQQMQMLREALSTPVSAGRAADVAEKLKRAHGECILKLGYLAQVPDYASGYPAAKRAWEQAEATFDTALAALAPTPRAADVERVAEAIYLGLYAKDGGKWYAVETKDVWYKIARSALAAVPPAWPGDVTAALREIVSQCHNLPRTATADRIATLAQAILAQSPGENNDG